VAGARTGLEAGAVPELGGVVIDVSRMDAVLKLHREDLMVTVQAGIRKSALAEWLKDKGFMFMVDPGSDATIGGYASTGARCASYACVSCGMCACLTFRLRAQWHAVDQVRHDP
jgi:FAD/FMN-containing dehydrogenase